MIEYLEKLVEEERNYSEGLSLAEQLMLDPNNSVFKMLVINHAMQTCRLYLKEFHGSIVSGQISLKLAGDLELWDYYGRSCINLAVAYGSMGQHNEALSMAYDYLAHLGSYSDAAVFDVRAWYNIGVAHGHLGNTKEAIHALGRAIELATAKGSFLAAHGVRHALIGAHMRTSDFSPVPCLLAQCLKFLRDNRDIDANEKSLLWHYVLRTRFAIATNRFYRARTVATKGLRLAKGNPELQYEFHMLLAKVAIASSEWGTALTHALSARMCSIRAHRYDAELAASELVYDITRHDPAAVLELKPGLGIPPAELFAHGAAVSH